LHRILRIPPARVLLALAAGALLASCGELGPLAVTVSSGTLGQYNAMPVISWEVGGSAVTRVQYSWDSGETWVELGPAVPSFRPDEPLAAGTHTVTVRYRAAGSWSEPVSETFTVVAVNASTPDDEYYAEFQWALPMVDMPLAWGLIDVLYPSRDGVVVAVVDTGYLDHPDLLANIDTVNDYDFIADVPTANDGGGLDGDAHDAGDDEGDGFGNSWHGTSVGGAIAAVTNNGSGIAGLARENVTILPLRALGVGGGLSYDIAQAVLYAAGLENDSLTTPAVPAKIINLSLGGGVFDPVLDSAMQDATAAGSIVVAASGNASDDPNWFGVGYPASSEYAIAAGSVGQLSDMAYYSQIGSALDVVGPGGDLSLGPQTGVLLPSADAFQSFPPSTYLYAFIQGTSFACPYVAGALAVLATVDPSLDLDTARSLLRRSSSDLTEPFVPGQFEVGILNVAGLFEVHLDGRIASEVERPVFSVRAASVDGTQSVATGRLSRSPAPQSEAPPAEFRDQSTLIVVLRDDRVVPAVAGVASARGTTGNMRLITVEPGSSLQTVRDQLLSRSEVSEVHYNYRYRPL
jgi:subtilisin family serine protease